MNMCYPTSGKDHDCHFPRPSANFWGKLKTVVTKRYISSSPLKSLTDYSVVPEGETNIQAVYNASRCKLNLALWAPNFGRKPALSPKLSLFQSQQETAKKYAFQSRTELLQFSITLGNKMLPGRGGFLLNIQGHGLGSSHKSYQELEYLHYYLKSNGIS
eukprot:272383-Ditylum_brightwellii.AAC.1